MAEATPITLNLEDLDPTVAGMLTGAPDQSGGAGGAAYQNTGAFRGDIIQKVSYTHEALIDFIIANPTSKLSDIGRAFDRHPVTIRRLMTSDIFREKLAARRLALVDPALTARLEDHFEAIALQSLQVLQEKLSLPSSMVSDNLAVKGAELGARALGVGGFSSKPAPAAPPANDSLERLAQRLTGFLGRPPTGEVVDVSSRPVPQPL